MGLLARIFARTHFILTGSHDLGTPSIEVDRAATLAHEFGSGTAAFQADRVFADQRTLAASASESLDLAGNLTDPLGASVAFAKVKALEIRAANNNVNDVVVGGAAANAFVGPFGDATDKMKVPPGGVVILLAPANGWPVTAGTADLLQVANGGAGSPVTYDVAIVGTSA